MRADAARNRQRLVDAAAEVFADRGLDATLDDIARYAGVNVATAYRHFASKHELATAFLQQTLDHACAIAEEAAAADDPWAALTGFLEQALQQMAANRGLVDVLTRAYGAEWFEDRLKHLITGPVQRLITRGKQAAVVRADVDAADLAVILPLVSSLTELAPPGSPQLASRYLSLVLAGLRPADTPLEGKPPTDAELRAAIAKPPEPRPARPRHQARPRQDSRATGSPVRSGEKMKIKPNGPGCLHPGTSDCCGGTGPAAYHPQVARHRLVGGVGIIVFTVGSAHRPELLLQPGEGQQVLHPEW